MMDNNTLEFSHPRLVSVFDTVNPIGTYRDFYTTLLDTLSAKDIVDFGCGTGLLTMACSTSERKITGIDPSRELIQQAKQRDTDNRINWVVASRFDDLPDASVDIVLLSGHVAQFLTDEESWQRFLAGASRVLRNGGYLLFESRNPHIEPFQNWPNRDYPKRFDNSPEGPFSWWWKGGEWAKNIFTYSLMYAFESPKEIVESPMSLIFRTKEAILSDAQKHGFILKNLFGDWDFRDFSGSSEEMIFLMETVHPSPGRVFI